MRRGLFKTILKILICFIFVYISNNLLNEPSIKPVSKQLSSSDLQRSFTLNNAYTPNSKKYLIFSCSQPCNRPSCFKRQICGGLGDRFKGISSAFLWAILTNRTFLIYYTYPCLLQDFYDSNLIEWYKNINEIMAKIDSNQLTSTRIDIYSTIYGLNIWENNRLLPTVIDKVDLLSFHKDDDVILFKTNYDLSNIIINNTIMYENRVGEFGLKLKNLKMSHSFYSIYNMLFRLKPSLQVKYDDFVRKARPNPHVKLICAQIRMGGKTDKYLDDVRMDMKQIVNIWDFIKRNFSDLIQSKNYRLYVTSDNDEVYKQAFEAFDVNHVITTDGESTHIDRDFQNNNGGTCKRHDKTYLDFHLLGACDMGVISRSGFGRLGVYNKPDSYEFIYTYKVVNGQYKFFRTW